MLLARRLTLILPLACACDAPSPENADTWTVARPLPVPRFEAYAAAANDSVYFLGGITGSFGDLASAEPSRRVDVYDPRTDTWSDGPPLPAGGPKHHLAVTVYGGEIYILGGFDGILGQHPSEPFEPVARAFVLRGSSWIELSPPPLARGAATAQAIGGRIYVTGGASTENVPPFDELDVYDPAADRWSIGPPMPTPREHLASCAAGGRFIVVGGWNEDVASNAAEAYDPQSNAWTKLAPMPTARGGLAAIAERGRCHVIGGEDWALAFPGTFHAHEVFDPATGGWTTLAPMPTARHGLGLALFGGAIYAVGGGPAQGNSYTNVVEVYLP